jgi:TetR/AcrR family transcriptional regulator
MRSTTVRRNEEWAGLCTREAIRAVATRSFADQGYHRTSLAQVAESVGIQKASLFHYFPTKEALYRAVLEEGQEQVETIIRRVLASGGDWLAAVRALVDAYVDLVAAHPEQTKILLRQSLGDVPDGWDGRPASDRLLGLVTGFLADGQRAGAFAPVDGQSLVLGVIGIVVFFFTLAPVVAPGWHRERPPAERVELVRCQVAAMVERALACGTTAMRSDRLDARAG